jgi:hypothetical protein
MFVYLHYQLIKKQNKMENLSNIKVGQEVKYKSSASIYNGIVVKKKQDSLIVVHGRDGMELWNAGYSVGSEVYAEQIVK